jgi:bacterial/archaeal transporter family protein
MVPPPSASERSSAATLAGLPRWLAFSLLTIVCWGAWGAVSKVASDGVDANTNQIFFTLGLLPLIVYVARSPRLKGGAKRRAGIGWAFLTGILGGTGNIAFFRALGVGGQASVVVPATALFPVVTVILALSFLRERLGRAQIAGLAIALVAIYLLSTG